MSDPNYFPVSRFTDYNKCNFYYAYGNTPPEDLLQSITAYVSEPEVLLLGCGDIRSCLYTLWSNFDSRNSRHFKGVHFVLNDISAAILARNIMFLYLCTKMPSDKDDVMKWVASFWSIWFCHELLPQHKQVLMDALSQLLEWSKSAKSWSERTDNLLQKFIKFATSESLAKVRRIWQMWYNDDRPVENVRTLRSSFLKMSSADDHQNAKTHLIRLFGNYLESKLSDSDRKCMKNEFEIYYQNGFAFVEGLLNLPVPATTSANSTFFEAADGTYNLHGNSFPYRCFFHSFHFSSENLKKLGYSGFSLIIKDEIFHQQPLLANCVQQFSVWIRSCGDIFSKLKYHNVLFTFHCSDAVEFCHLLCDYRHRAHRSHFPCLFDAIYTSNLIDYIATPSFVLAAMSVLKQAGFLFTDTFRHIMVSNTLSGFTKALFGFESKYLPLICGVRCIGNDDEYSDELAIKPVPYTTEFDILYSVITKSLVWQHVTSMPLKQITTEHFASMMGILCSSINHMLTCCMGNHNGSVTESLLCTATVMQLLKSFVSQLDGRDYDHTKYQFWTPLCSMLLNDKGLQPFMMSLQSQAFLHGLHLHLMVSEVNCPLCNKIPLHDFISLYSITIEKHAVNTSNYEPRLSILIHNVTPVDAVVMKAWKEAITTCDDKVYMHVVDSIAGRETDGKLQLDFYLPVSFLQDNYYVSVISSNYEAVRSPVSAVVMHKNLNNCKISANYYSFNQCFQPQPNPVCSTLGEITQHSGNADCFESVIILSDQSMSALQHHQVTTRQLSSTNVDFIIGSFHVEISYPYPVDYTTMSVKLSRKSKRITVVACRKQHQLYEEKPIYIVNPDSMLSLPIMLSYKEDELEHYSAIQFNAKERAIMQRTNRNPMIMPPEINLKETWTVILQQHKENFFQLVNSGRPTNVDQWCQNIQCFLVVQNRLFDLHNRTPSIDLHFCFLTPEKCKRIFRQWISTYENETSMSELRDILVDKKECWLLQNILNYFASRTVSTLMKPISARYKLLVKHKISQYFTRAVIYPLYSNSSMTGLEIPNPFDLRSLSISKPVLDQSKCSFCGKHSEDLKKCSRCRLMQYCNRECQKKHWRTHKSACFPQ